MPGGHMFDRSMRNIAFVVVGAVFGLLLHISVYANDWGNCLNGDVWLTVDTSDSMSGYESSMSETIGFIARKIIDSYPNSRVGLVIFNTNPYIVKDLTRDTSQFEDLALTAGGGTKIANALLGVSSHHEMNLEKEREYSEDYRRIIFLISDGEDKINDVFRIAKYIRTKSAAWDIFSVHYFKGKYESSANQKNANLMMQVSGSRYNIDSNLYVSSSLDGLPEFMREQFSCM